MLDAVLFLFADNRCAYHSAAADKQQGHPQRKAAVVAGLRRLRFIRRAATALSRFDLKLRAALAVIIDDSKGVLADRKRAEVIFFQRDDRRAGYGGILIRVNERAVNLNAGELGEISVCYKLQRAVAVLRPGTVCTVCDFVFGRMPEACGVIVRSVRTHIVPSEPSLVSPS